MHAGTRAPGSESGERGRRSLHASLGARSPSGSCGSREFTDHQFGPTGPFNDDQAPFSQPEPCYLQPCWDRAERPRLQLRKSRSLFTGL